MLRLRMPVERAERGKGVPLEVGGKKDGRDGQVDGGQGVCYT